MAKYTAQDRRDLAAKGHALPDGSFPIADEEDLHSAISNWALGKQPNVAKQFIVKRARALGKYAVLPEKWRAALEHEADEQADDFLEHFGILGMKWGVRREDPSGSGRRSHSSSESTGTRSRGSSANTGGDSAAVKKPKTLSPEKAAEKVQKDKIRDAKRELKGQKFDKIAGGYQRQIDKINDKAAGKKLSRGRRKDLEELTELKTQAVKDAESSRQGKMTSGQKKLLIGAGVAAAVVASAATYAAIQSGQGNRLIAQGKALIQGKKATDFNIKNALKEAKTPEQVLSDVVKHINPDYGDIGTKMNCRRCTFAYELRRRGFDVRATRTTNASGQTAAGLLNALNDDGKEISTNIYSVIGRTIQESIRSDRSKHGATPLNDISKHFTAGSRNSIAEPGVLNIIRELSKQPEGSRGELGVSWLTGGGHSMAYEIFKGKPVIFDGQTGQKLESISDLAGHGLDKISAAGFTRLDNINLNEEYLLRWVKNAD